MGLTMRSDKNHALKLRLSGRSYSEIKTSLGVPKSTLSGWFSNLQLSPTAQKRLASRAYKKSMMGLLKRNRRQTHLALQRKLKIQKTAERGIRHINQQELKLIGIALYWAEGYKRAIKRNGREVTHHPVALSNSDPNLVKIFIRFLIEICKIPKNKITANVRIYQYMNEKELLTFWQKTTDLPEVNFGKVYYGISKSSLGKRPFNVLPHGTISIRVNSTNLFHQMMGWISGISDEKKYLQK